MAGHSKWANIRIRKGKQDAAKSNLFTKLSRELIVAAKSGGPDPETNSQLRAAIAKAKLNRMPNDVIKRSIEKAAGTGEGTQLESLTYEGYGPGGVAIMVRCLTDNKNRTVPELRHAFSKEGGNLAENGSVSWQFKHQGELIVAADGTDEESLLLTAMEAGADDVQKDDGIFTVTTPVEAFHAVRDRLENANFPIERADLAMIPTNKVEISREDAEKLLRLLERLEELDDVQDTYFNADLPDDL